MPVDTRPKITTIQNPSAQQQQGAAKVNTHSPKRIDVANAVGRPGQGLPNTLSLVVGKFLADLGHKVIVDILPARPSLPKFVQDICQANLAQIPKEHRTVPEKIIAFAVNKALDPKLIAALTIALNEDARNSWKKAAPQMETINLSQLLGPPPKPQMPVSSVSNKPAPTQRISNGNIRICVNSPRLILFFGENGLGDISGPVGRGAAAELKLLGEA